MLIIASSLISRPREELQENVEGGEEMRREVSHGKVKQSDREKEAVRGEREKTDHDKI